MHDGQADPTAGVHFIGIMGDGAGAFLAALNSELVKSFGQDYRAEIIGSCPVASVLTLPAGSLRTRSRLAAMVGSAGALQSMKYLRMADHRASSKVRLSS